VKINRKEDATSPLPYGRGLCRKKLK